MLNKLNTGQATIKDNFLKVINRNLESILSQKVMQDPVRYPFSLDFAVLENYLLLVYRLSRGVHTAVYSDFDELDAGGGWTLFAV